MKKFIILLTTVLSVMSASAQTTETKKACDKQQCCKEFNPSWFVNFQGGFQKPNTTWKSNCVSPAFSLNVGRNVNRLMSVRVGLEGCNSKAYDYDWVKQNFKYATGSFDAMFNVIGLFTKKNCCPVRFYLIGGVGCNWTGQTNNSSSSFSPNFRLATQIDWRLTKNFAVNFEYRADNTSDIFNGRLENGTHDWYSSFYLGVSLVLPDSKPVVKVIDHTDELNALNDRIKALEDENAALKNRKPEVKEVVKEVTKTVAIFPNVFFDCDKSKINLQQTANVKMVADYMKANPNVKIDITGYASPEGNAAHNQKLSEKRANAVAEMLVKKYGISRDRISTVVGGPTNEIYPDQKSLNRVCVSVAK